MRVADRTAGTIDYRLNLLGVRVFEHCCQLIARAGEEWTVLGPSWDLPLHIPRNAEELKAAALDTLRMTAYQYNTERPGSDLAEVLNRSKPFSAVMAEGFVVAAVNE
jgi:hypothetical protein